MNSYSRNRNLNIYRQYMQSNIEKAEKADHIIHNHMIYECKDCGSVYVMSLEKGLEDPTSDAEGGFHKPVPFCIRCIVCGRDARHILWGTILLLETNYHSYAAMKANYNGLFRNFFYNDPDIECGIPILYEPDFLNQSILFKFLCSLNDLKYINPELLSVETVENRIDITPTINLNRAFRRHGIVNNSSYKRPRKNQSIF